MSRVRARIGRFRFCTAGVVQPLQRTLSACKLISRPAPVALCALLLVFSFSGCSSTSKNQKNVAAPESYMRVTRPDPDTVQLQIAARRFNPARGRGPDIWLVGASHIG